MTERTRISPTSRKGEVRAAALRVLDHAAQSGLSVTTARSADFYGPGATTSVFERFVVDPTARGKRATWLLDADQPHSLTFTPDLGDTLALLGTTAEAWGRTWHVPTAPARTGRQCIEFAAGDGARFSVMGRTMMRIGAAFDRSARETLEMAYQFAEPSVLDSSEFEEPFGVRPTPLADGIARSLNAARSRR